MLVCKNAIFASLHERSQAKPAYSFFSVNFAQWEARGERASGVQRRWIARGESRPLGERMSQQNFFLFFQKKNKNINWILLTMGKKCTQVVHIFIHNLQAARHPWGLCRAKRGRRKSAKPSALFGANLCRFVKFARGFILIFSNFLKNFNLFFIYFFFIF